ncbi:MAG: hypothetical protein ACD_26C00051G0001 [uncultured bacterium]|nr:MAG: hypothetical protein ACD_26C00051G0001 [uncultured bacterium]
MSTSNKCPKCQEEIQADAKKCKHCQADLRNWLVRHKIITGILVLFGLGIISSALGNTDSTNNSNSTNYLPNKNVEANQVVEIPIKITAIELANAYEKNEVKADKDYKGKTLEITGTIKEIGTILSQTFIVLSSGKEFSITDIQCFFDDQAQIDKIAELSKGNQITVQCKVDGKSLNVGVRNCIIK